MANGQNSLSGVAAFNPHYERLLSVIRCGNMQQVSHSCNQDLEASTEFSLLSTRDVCLSIECSVGTSSCSELVIGLQNTTKAYTCTVAQATVSSPMQIQATQLITRRADYRSELVIGLEKCIKLVGCTKVTQQETDCTASGKMTLAKRDILIHR